MLQGKLVDLMQKHEIHFGVLADLNFGTIQHFGDRNKLRYTSMVDRLFGDMQSVQTLNDSLEGQPMPRSWSQGEMLCIVCKPREGLLIGLFYSEHRNVMESYSFSEQINEDVQKIWSE